MKIRITIEDENDVARVRQQTVVEDISLDYLADMVFDMLPDIILEWHKWLIASEKYKLYNKYK